MPSELISKEELIITDTVCLSGFLQPHLFLARFLLGEGPEPGSMAEQAPSKAEEHTVLRLFSGTVSPEGQRDSSSSLQKAGKAVCYTADKSVNHLNKPEDRAKTQQETFLVDLAL